MAGGVLDALKQVMKRVPLSGCNAGAAAREKNLVISALIRRHFGVIHPTAIVSPLASLGRNVRIGPFCIVGANVELGDDCVLHSHVVLEGHSKFGRSNEFFPFAAIGGKTQDLKYVGDPTYLEVGDHNVFRENTTVHRGTHESLPTRIGSHNLLLCYSHVAHDCQLGDHIILSNSVGLAGHITVEDHAIVSGVAGVHQFVRIGKHSIIGGYSKVVQDVPPFMIVDGHPATTRGLNIIGLQRRGFAEDDIKALKSAYNNPHFPALRSGPLALSGASRRKQTSSS